MFSFCLFFPIISFPHFSIRHIYVVGTHLRFSHWGDTEYPHFALDDKRGYPENIFLFLHENICCGYSLEATQQGPSNEYPQYILTDLKTQHPFHVLVLQIFANMDQWDNIFKLFLTIMVVILIIDFCARIFKPQCCLNDIFSMFQKDIAYQILWSCCQMNNV